jgi:hypothetical protein
MTKRLGAKIVEEILSLLKNNFLTNFVDLAFLRFLKKPSLSFALSSLIIFLTISTFTVLTTSCGITQTRPKLEMELAAAAYLAARNVKANVVSPVLFRKGEVFYLKARSSYRRKYFNKAKQYAILSKKFSEQAEFAARKQSVLENE